MNEKVIPKDLDYKSIARSSKTYLIEKVRKGREAGKHSDDIIKEIENHGEWLKHKKAEKMKSIKNIRHMMINNVEYLFEGESFVGWYPPKKLRVTFTSTTPGLLPPVNPEYFIDIYRQQKAGKNHFSNRRRLTAKYLKKKNKLVKDIKLLSSKQGIYRYQSLYEKILDSYKILAQAFEQTPQINGFKSHLDRLINCRKKYEAYGVKAWPIGEIKTRLEAGTIAEYLNANELSVNNELTDEERFKEDIAQRIKKVVHKKPFEPKNELVQEIHQRYSQKIEGWEWNDSTDLFNELGEHKEFPDADNYHRKSYNWRQRQRK